jgi:hypothetical protein
MNWHHMKLFDYEYALCPTKREWDAYWKKIGNDPQPYLTCAGRATFFKTSEGKTGLTTARAIVTVADDFDVDGIQIAAVLAHEVVHIKQDICERIGEDKISSEMEAYIVQTILQDLMYDFKRTRL